MACRTENRNFLIILSLIDASESVDRMDIRW